MGLQAIITNVPAKTVTIRVSAALEPGQGTAYYDGMQLEKGNVVSAYNLIENSSFERYSSPTAKIPLSWTPSSNLSASDGRDQNASEIDTKVYVGNYSFKLTGEKGKNKYVVQRVLISGDASTKFTLSGWSYQEGADPNGGNYGLQLGINHTDGTIDWRFANDFSKTTFGWQHLSVVVEPAKPFQSIDVYLLYYNQSGSAWFDAMRLETAPSHTSYEYDEGKSYVTLIKDPLGNTASYSYDYFGNTTGIIDGNGNKTINTYNGANELTSVKDAKGFTTSYLYDGEGNLTEVTNPKGYKQTSQFNELNQLTKWTDSLNRSTSYEFDSHGNQTKIRNPNNTIISNIFDISNRLASVSYNNVKQFDLEYDVNDNLIKVTKTGGLSTTFSYDLNNRLVSETEGVNTTGYAYDDNSNLTGLSIAGGSKTDFIYNSLNLLSTILKNNLTIVNHIYNESGQVLSNHFNNGTYTSFEYNGANQLVSQTNYNVGGVVGERFTNSFDKNGNIVNIQIPRLDHSFQMINFRELLITKFYKMAILI
ncbi:MAG TPA: RHS repeat protein [Bacillales bacterium]|nr:RHS repeat protein [Bacillales bacterium]